jgi:VanZ family protein
MKKTTTTGFRIALCAALVVITHLATTAIHYPVVSGINDKLNHLMAFYTLAFLADFSFPNTNLNLAKIILLLLYGFSIECIQYYLPYRTFSLFDFGADAVGIIAYGMSLPFLKHIPLLQNRCQIKNTACEVAPITKIKTTLNK